MGEVPFREHFSRDADAIDSGRHAAVDRDLQEHFHDLCGTDAVVERAADVRCPVTWNEQASRAW